MRNGQLSFLPKAEGPQNEALPSDFPIYRIGFLVPAVNWIYPLSKFDGEGVPNYPEAERHAGRWNGEAPAPPLPHELVLATGERYLEAFRRLTAGSGLLGHAERGYGRGSTRRA